MIKLKISHISQHTNQVSKDCGAAVLAELANTTLDDVMGTSALLRIDMPLSFQEVYKLLTYYGITHHYVAGLTVEQIRHGLAKGLPTIILASYRQVPNRQSSFTGAHWFLAVGYDENGVFVHDSNWWGQRVKEGEYLYLPDGLLHEMMADPSGGDPDWQARPFQGIVINEMYPFLKAAGEETAVTHDDETAAMLERLLAELATQTARADKAVAVLNQIGELLRDYEA